jgi:hypothetical protein
LLFLPRNISQPKGLSPGSARSNASAIVSLVAVKNGTVVGCGTLVRDPHSWSPHVGEIRMVVSQDVRRQGSAGRCHRNLRVGLGRRRKAVVQMTVDQQAAITLFESLAQG